MTPLPEASSLQSKVVSAAVHLRASKEEVLAYIIIRALPEIILAVIPLSFLIFWVAIYSHV
jgi:hypothetical protein